MPLAEEVVEVVEEVPAEVVVVVVVVMLGKGEVTSLEVTGVEQGTWVVVTCMVAIREVACTVQVMVKITQRRLIITEVTGEDMAVAMIRQLTVNKMPLAVEAVAAVVVDAEEEVVDIDPIDTW